MLQFLSSFELVMHETIKKIPSDCVISAQRKTHDRVVSWDPISLNWDYHVVRQPNPVRWWKNTDRFQNGCLDVPTLHLFGLNFQFLSCHNPVWMLRQGLLTKSIWLGLVKEPGFALKYLFWSPWSWVEMTPGVPKDIQQWDSNCGGLYKCHHWPLRLPIWKADDNLKVIMPRLVQIRWPALADIQRFVQTDALLWLWCKFLWLNVPPTTTSDW